MADNSSREAWTDRQKLAFVWTVLDSLPKGSIDWNKVPVPKGRTQLACKRMVDKLKGQLKDELTSMELLKAAGDSTPDTKKRGAATEEDTPTKPKATPKKRKGKAAEKVAEDADPKDNEDNIKKEQDIDMP